MDIPPAVQRGQSMPPSGGNGVLMSDMIKNCCKKWEIRVPFSDDVLNQLRSVVFSNSTTPSSLWTNRTDSSGVDPYAFFPRYIAELVEHKNPGNYIVFGEYAKSFHLFVVEDHFVYLGQTQSNGDTVVNSYQQVKALIEEGLRDGKIPAHGTKLVVVDSNHPRSRSHSGCAWIDASTNEDTIQWRKPDAIFRTPYAVALSMVNALKPLT